MGYSQSISLKCSHCNALCQFTVLGSSHSYCKIDKLHYITYKCSNCEGAILTKWSANIDNIQNFVNFPSHYNQKLQNYYPIVGDWSPRVKLSLIKNEEVKADFMEAINCYNNSFYNACMMMARRAIQQEMISCKAKGDNLYKQIESTGISKRLKGLLQKIKNFGNYGAHPDFCLFDDEGNEITDKKEFAKLSLEFLDRYFADEYEIDSLVENAPKSEKELKTSK